MTDRPRSSRDDVAQTAADRRFPQEQAVTGVVGDAVASRSGEDARRRGWFWHWNTIVTQYAPLLGLKGVGLLNSYTVWTDRREESPHRGYAFPSQQSEADFYGEDRAELITINKILVALDLIEIRKEMVLRTDELGRRWKVPHNFYRVKDNSDRHTLTADDVMRVVELADRDQGVYRYVRRIFSERFRPIDRDNVWVQILAEVGTTEVWQRLAERAAREESRASARTRAGHAARKASFGMPSDRDTATPIGAINDSTADSNQEGLETIVATSNNGLGVGVEEGNNGLKRVAQRDVAQSNDDPPTDVAPTNTTYYQFESTTTTTSLEPNHQVLGQAQDVSRGAVEVALTGDAGVVTGDVTGSRALGPGGRPAPADRGGEAAAVRAFEDANGRPASAAERHLLRNLAERFDPAARDQGDHGRSTGWEWVAAAVYDAVEAGSRYVAPRRVREILARWEREGLPNQEAHGPAPAPKEKAGAAAVTLGDGPDLSLPHGFGSRETWAFTVRLLGAAIGRERLDQLVRGTSITGYQDGEMVIASTSESQAALLTGEYRELVVRKLSEAMRRPVRLAVSIPTPDGPSPDDDPPPSARSFTVPEVGLPSHHVWEAVIDELLGSTKIGRATVDAWIRPARLIGRDPDGCFIVGAPHPLAQRRVESRYLSALIGAFSVVTAGNAAVRVVVANEWLRTEHGATNDASQLAG